MHQACSTRAPARRAPPGNGRKRRLAAGAHVLDHQGLAPAARLPSIRRPAPCSFACLRTRNASRARRGRAPRARSRPRSDRRRASRPPTAVMARAVLELARERVAGEAADEVRALGVEAGAADVDVERARSARGELEPPKASERWARMLSRPARSGRRFEGWGRHGSSASVWGSVALCPAPAAACQARGRLTPRARAATLNVQLVRPFPLAELVHAWTRTTRRPARPSRWPRFPPPRARPSRSGRAPARSTALRPEAGLIATPAYAAHKLVLELAPQAGASRAGAAALSALPRSTRWPRASA